MAFAPGTLAYVEVDGEAKTMDSWSLSTDCEVADVSDYERRSATFLPGIPSAILTLSGPYSVGSLGVRQGQVYPFELGYTATNYVRVEALVKSVKLMTGVRDVARTEVTAVVTSDLENEDLSDPYYPNSDFEDL